MPLVIEYEARMNHYKGPKLQRVELKLASKEKRIIAFFLINAIFIQTIMHEIYGKHLA